MGEAFQFDWSEEGLLIGGLFRRIQVSRMKLCASRAFWLVAYPSQGREMWFDAHTRSLGALGGVRRRSIYDNMKTAVNKVKGRTVNAWFAVMCAHHLFDPDFCNTIRISAAINETLDQRLRALAKLPALYFFRILFRRIQSPAQ